MTEQGWHADPTGRRFKRWYDGSTWTQHTVGPDGAIVEDALRPDDGRPAAPGAGATPAAADQQTSERRPPEQPPQTWRQPAEQPAQQQTWQTGQQGWQTGQQGWQSGQQAQGPPQGWQPPQGGGWGGPGPAGRRESYGPGPGIAVAAVGVLCLVLSLFALKWGDASKSTFLDLGTSARDRPGGAHLDAAQHVAVLYASWAGFVLFGLAVVLVLLAGVPVPRSAAGNTYARVAGALIVGLGAVGQMITVAQAFKGDATPQFGAWLGVGGWIVVGVGFALGARRTSA